VWSCSAWLRHTLHYINALSNAYCVDRTSVYHFRHSVQYLLAVPVVGVAVCRVHLRNGMILWKGTWRKWDGILCYWILSAVTASLQSSAVDKVAADCPRSKVSRDTAMCTEVRSVPALSFPQRFCWGFRCSSVWRPGEWFPTFRKIVMPSSVGVKQSSSTGGLDPK
jgi:hypothetical protein